MSKILLIIMLGIFYFPKAQIYKPIDTADYIVRKNFLTNYSKDSQVFNKKVKEKYEGKTGRDLSNSLSRFQIYFQEEVKNKNFVFNSVFNKYITTVFEEITKSNGLDFQNVKLLIEKDNTPNAYCTSDGILVFNMGLFSWLENQDQIASVICHELGHLFLDHNIKAKLRDIKLENNGKEEVKSLASTLNNKGDQAYKIYKRKLYKFSAERRKHENEADSLGFVFYSKSGFSKPEFKKALMVLKKSDTLSPVVLKVETYKQFFDLPDHPFKEKWLQKEDFSTYNYSHYKEKIDKDSVASHPEMEMRIKYLDKKFVEPNDTRETVKPSVEFLELEKIATMEVLPNFYQSEDYGDAIYTALQLLQTKESEHEYYKYWLGKNFEKILEARKKYTLNRYLDKVEPKNQSESYQQFLNFMWNLSLDDIQNITAFYTKKSL